MSSLAACGLRGAASGVVMFFGLAGVGQASGLTDLLRKTLDNPSIVAHELQAQAAAKDARAADLRYFGQAALFAGTNRYNSPRVVGIFTPGVTPLPVPVSQEISQYGIGYHLPVDVFGVIAAERAQVQAGKATARLLVRQEILLRLHQTLAAYVRLQALSAQAQALQAEEKQLSVYASRVRAEVALGRTPKLELTLVQSDLARLGAQQAILEGNRRAASAELVASANAASPSISETIVVPALQKNDVMASLPVTLAREQEASATASAKKARSSLFPAFSVDSQYAGYAGAGVQPHAWTVGVNMTFPLDPSGMQNASAAMERARAAKEASLAVAADTLSQIASLEANYRSSLENAKALDSEVEHRQAVVAVEREKWRLGAGTMESLLYEERNLLDSRFALADARAQAATAWSGMQTLLGTPFTRYISSLETTP